MADTEEPQFTTLAERIAALNKQKNFSVDGHSSSSPASFPAKKKPPPPPVPAAGKLPSAVVVPANRPTPTPRIPPPSSETKAPPPLPRRDTQNSSKELSRVTQPPPLPSRTNSTQPRPALPTRTSTSQSGYLTTRRNSASSEISQLSTVSGASLGRVSSAASTGSDGRRIAPAYDPSSLPPLPPTKREKEAQARREEATPSPRLLRTQTSSSRVPQIQAPLTPPATTSVVRPSLPPRLPSRPAKSQTPGTNGFHGRGAVSEVKEDPVQPLPPPRPNGAKTPTQPANRIRGFGTAKRPNIPERTAEPDADEAPPPIPVASRPSASQIKASQTSTAQPAPNNFCWVCRDWSGPDNVAAQYPRQSLPRQDPVGHLARGLCDPFPSYTDKARAIFTWFHHNIFYDTVAFFGNNVRPQTVEDTIFSGKAVCQGYAETYKAIAERAGLECLMVVGHGKGYGHNALKKGERPPPAKPDGHAWNAVRIDGGEWKLLDACWGAGHICGDNNLYKQEFSPGEFIRPNDVFGRTHFPQNPNHQLRPDGTTISWEEYFRGRVDGEPVLCYTNAKQEGIAEDSIEPRERQIPVGGDGTRVIRFQFSKICEHWTSEKDGLGKPPLLLLSTHGLHGRKDAMIPIETDGYWHWVDVRVEDLGVAGQEVQVAQLTSIDGKDGRGVSAQEFQSKQGRVGMGWSYVMRWDLV